MHSRVGQIRTIFSAKSCDALNVAKLSHLCHKPGFVDRLIKGCRGDDRAGFISFRKLAEHNQRSNEHFRPMQRPPGRFLRG
jgi:hypothetical protein